MCDVVTLFVMSSGLYQAVVEGRYQHVKYLLDTGVRVNSHNQYGETPLIGALRWINSRQRRLRMLRWLLLLGADVCASDPRTQKDALLWATFLNRTDEVRLMLKNHEVDIDLRHVDIHGRCALHYAVLHDNEHVLLYLVKRFRKYRMCVDIKDNYQITPYLMATELGNPGCIHILLEVGEASRTQNQTTFHDASDIWIGLDDWLDPRIAIAPSKPMDLSVLYNTGRKLVTQSKVTFAPVVSQSAEEMSEHRPISGKTCRSDVIIIPASSRRLARSNKRLSSKSSDFVSTATRSSSSSESPDQYTNHRPSYKAMDDDVIVPGFLPPIAPAADVTRAQQSRPSASIKRKAIPLMFDMYADQRCASFRAAARRPVTRARVPMPPSSKKALKSSGISIGALGKVSKFAALLKLKTKATKQLKQT